MRFLECRNTLSSPPQKNEDWQLKREWLKFLPRWVKICSLQIFLETGHRFVLTSTGTVESKWYCTTFDLQWNLSWKAIAMRRAVWKTTYFWQKVLCSNEIEPITSHHQTWVTTFFNGRLVSFSRQVLLCILALSVCFRVVMKLIAMLIFVLEWSWNLSQCRFVF